MSLNLFTNLTNLLAFGATTIAAIYKERWQIELDTERHGWNTIRVERSAAARKTKAAIS